MAETSKESAKFVFRGTVKQMQAANLKAVTDKKRTAIVEVNEIDRAPQALSGFAGRDVTVQLAKGERVKKGQQALFYTNGWIFGENLAVQSVGHDSVSGRTAAQAAERTEDPVTAASQIEIREQSSGAKLVVSGKVIAVGEIDNPPAVTAALETGGHKPISEHEPFWNEAVVEVDKVHKGQTRKNRVVVRFPASTDVRWSRAPKFQVGNQGVFMLQPDEVSRLESVGATAIAMDSQECYTCLQPSGFQPADDEPGIAAALGALGSDT